MNEESELTYSQAKARLDHIESQLQDPAIDIDLLEELVKEAAGLIDFCNARIARVQTSVKDVFGQAAA